MSSLLLQFFEYGHLKEPLKETSRQFCILAYRVADADRSPEDRELAMGNIGRLIAWIETDFAPNPETTHAQTKLDEAKRMLGAHDLDEVLRKVLEAKDCAVRSRIFKYYPELKPPPEVKP